MNSPVRAFQTDQIHNLDGYIIEGTRYLTRLDIQPFQVSGIWLNILFDIQSVIWQTRYQIYDKIFDS